MRILYGCDFACESLTKTVQCSRRGRRGTVGHVRHRTAHPPGLGEGQTHVADRKPDPPAAGADAEAGAVAAAEGLVPDRASVGSPPRSGKSQKTNNKLQRVSRIHP